MGVPGYKYHCYYDLQTKTLTNRLYSGGCVFAGRVAQRFITDAFGGDVDYAMLVKTYGTDPGVPAGRYSPGYEGLRDGSNLRRAGRQARQHQLR
jgi:hypothetical protein